MSDLISREALLKEIRNVFCVGCGDQNAERCCACSFDDVISYIVAAPSIPMRHGRWIAQDETFTRFTCSECKAKNYDGSDNHCPNCGAKMDLEECDLGDLISREAALEKIGEAFRATDPKGEEQFGILKCSRMVREMPAVDAVEVVRCKDCGFFMEYRERTETADGDCQCKMFDDEDHLLCLPVHYGDYCSRGRKRE